jgi:hypothetical protein
MEKAFKPLKGTLDDGVVLISGNWAIGASGAVSTKTRARGVTLTRTAAGTYSLQLNGYRNASASVPAILHCGVNVITSDADPTNDAAAISARVLTMTASTGIVTFQTFDEAGVAADPASGAKVSILLVFAVVSAAR